MCRVPNVLEQQGVGLSLSVRDSPSPRTVPLRACHPRRLAALPQPQRHRGGAAPCWACTLPVLVHIAFHLVLGSIAHTAWIS